MAGVEAPGRPAFAHGRRLYVRAPRPIDFPSEEPLEEHVPETKRHLERYQASGMREVVRFDPANAEQPIQAWDRIEGELLERSPSSPELRECTALGLWWVVLPSAYGPMLRLARDREGKDLLPTPSEDRRRLAEELAEERQARTNACWSGRSPRRSWRSSNRRGRSPRKSGSSRMLRTSTGAGEPTWEASS
jgi:hypothetical protein